MCAALKNEFRELLGDNGVFLYPTHPVPAPYHNQPLTLIPNFAYTGIFNVLGMPCTCVPMGLSKQGVPIGFQVVSWQYNDRLTIAVAEELERAFGGWVPPFKR
jgi:fatty acid amide hydrolase 2